VAVSQAGFGVLWFTQRRREHKADISVKRIHHNGRDVKVYAFLHTAEVDGLLTPCKEYWRDSIDKALEGVSPS